MSDTSDKLLFLFAGWLLSTLTSFANHLHRQGIEKRTVFAHLSRMLADILVHMELSDAWREAGGIDTVLGLLEVDESWREKIPPSPPRLPQDSDSILERVADWEAKQGRWDLTRDLFGVKYKLGLLWQLHAGLSAYAKDPNLGPIPDRSVKAYSDVQETLKSDVSRLFKVVMTQQRKPHELISGKFQKLMESFQSLHKRLRRREVSQR
jgi:hypothetical protein